MTTEYSAAQRAVLTTLRLYHGEALSCQDVQELCGYRQKAGAWRLLQHLSGVLPLWVDEDGCYRWLADG